MAGHLLTGVLTVACLSFPVNAQDVPLPVRVSPSTKHYGPDGPWQAVTVKLGSPEQVVDLYPGGIYESQILTTNLCANSSVQPCGSGGLFDPSASDTLDVTSAKFDADWTSGAMSQPGKAQLVTDQLVFDDRNHLVSNLSMNLISNLTTIYPDGTRYPIQVGQLSLGAPSDNQTFNSVNASLIPNYLQDKKLIPSSSYGLHIGSAALNLPLSLWLGGYDSSRVLGPISSQPLPGSSLFTMDLLDMGIGVDQGASPFSYTERHGILAEGNSSISTSVSVIMNPGAPYMYLPNSTCNAITKDLPVTYNSKYGLYVWNTQDPKYKQIVTSPTYLSLTFRDSSGNLTIKMPFSLLNLTLEAPLVIQPTPYFPCQPPNNSTEYSLGRAFLQAAFIGVNWDRGNGNWFLAQAPGPNTAVTPVQKPITTSTIEGSNDDWADTWKTVWTPLPASDGPGSGSKSTSSGSGLSGGGIAGVVIAAASAILLFFVVGYFVRRRKHQRSRGESPPQPAWWTPSEKKNEADEPLPLYQRDITSAGSKGPRTVVEADSGTPAKSSEDIGVQELGGNERYEIHESGR